MRWRRKAADIGVADACMCLADFMYHDRPYAREAGACARLLFGSK